MLYHVYRIAYLYCNLQGKFFEKAPKQMEKWVAAPTLVSCKVEFFKEADHSFKNILSYSSLKIWFYKQVMQKEQKNT